VLSSPEYELAAFDTQGRPPVDEKRSTSTDSCWRVRRSITRKAKGKCMGGTVHHLKSERGWFAQPTPFLSSIARSNAARQHTIGRV